MLPASRVPPPSRRAPNWGSGRGAHLGTPSSSANHTAAASIDRLNREGSQLAASLEGEPGPTPAGKTLPHSFPETSRFRRERARGVASNNTKIGAHSCCCSSGFCGSIAAARKAQGARRKQKKAPQRNIAASWCPSVSRSGGPVFPAVSSVGWRVCYWHTIIPPPPPVPLPTQHPTYATIVTASLAQCTAVTSKKEKNVILLKNKASITRHPSGRAPLTPLPRNARDFPPVFCPYFSYWPAAARHPGFQPPSPPPNLHSPPVQLVPRRTLRGGSAGVWYDCFYPDTQGSFGFVYTVYIQKTSVLWRSPLLLQIN